MGILFDTLEKERNKKVIKKSEEITFFKRYKGLLKMNPYFSKYLECENVFDILKANIIIKSIINKEEFDSIISDEYISNPNSNIDLIKEKIREATSDLPYISYDNLKVYIPFFNKATNQVYYSDNEKMKEFPYVELQKRYDSFLIDPFETYEIDLYTSLFTQLVKIDESKTSVAFYHYDFNAIFIINRQGSLDNVIYLFDKHMKSPHKFNILEKVKPLVEAYYSNDLSHFIYKLYKNDLVSYYVFRKISKCKTK